jgi:hypothetical protein
MNEVSLLKIMGDWKEEIEDVYTVREISAKESDEEKPAAKKSIDDLKRLFGDL